MWPSGAEHEGERLGEASCPPARGAPAQPRNADPGTTATGSTHQRTGPGRGKPGSGYDKEAGPGFRRGGADGPTEG